MSDTPTGAGARLRAAREQRGMSVPKAAGELHLEPWVIEALEAGDLSRVGPPVYGKGFLRRYATLLGLPADEILAVYGMAPPPAGDAAEAVETFSPRAPVSASQMLGGLGLALLVGALVWWQPWASPGRPEPAVAAVEAPVDTARSPEIVPDAPVAQAVPAAPTLSVATPSPAAGPATVPAVTADAAPSDTSPEPGAGRAHLRLSFTADSWVDVRDAQGNKAFVGNGSANTVKSIAGAAPMHVYLRSGSGVQLEINGHAVAIAPQFFAGDVARFQAGADGVLRREAPREANAANTRPPG